MHTNDTLYVECFPYVAENKETFGDLSRSSVRERKININEKLFKAFIQYFYTNLILKSSDQISILLKSANLFPSVSLCLQMKRYTWLIFMQKLNLWPKKYFNKAKTLNIILINCFELNALFDLILFFDRKFLIMIFDQVTFWGHTHSGNLLSPFFFLFLSFSCKK